MIREICRCPYCGEGVVAVDDDLPEIVFDPDRPAGSPCPHLAFAWVGLHAAVECRAGFWLWALGEGLRRLLPGGPPEPLEDYINELCCDMSAEPPLSGVEFRIVGGTAGQREEQRLGSGDFWLAAEGAGDDLIDAYLDAWGIYAPDPGALGAVVRELVAGRP